MTNDALDASASPSAPTGEPRIYLLPNLMTAGNLFCGFAAVLRILHGMTLEGLDAHRYYHEAIAFILGACLFDLLDGRFARMSHQESAFGREFDSLADVISFGLAPALLVYDIVLAGIHERLGWIIAFLYLLCGAMRLARFNCQTASPADARPGEFLGFPIPAAAGVISSLTILLLWVEDNRRQIGNWKFALPFLMLALSALMFSRIKYPSFKMLAWRTRRTVPTVLFSIVALALTVLFWEWMPALLFTFYLVYGLVRPWVSRRWRRRLEIEPDDDADEPVAPPPVSHA